MSHILTRVTRVCTATGCAVQTVYPCIHNDIYYRGITRPVFHRLFFNYATPYHRQSTVTLFTTMHYISPGPRPLSESVPANRFWNTGSRKSLPNDNILHNYYVLMWTTYCNVTIQCVQWVLLYQYIQCVHWKSGTRSSYVIRISQRISPKAARV